MKKYKGFTIIELIVAIAIVSVLSGMILFSVTQYINKGKDSNISGGLSSLIPAGEVWYNGNSSNPNSYTDFCTASVVLNVFNNMPTGANPVCYVDSGGQKWAACAKKLTSTTVAYCVDSRGMKNEILLTTCSGFVSNTVSQCPLAGQ
jgi:prepilin-type N-terminal cleavage/methylation domain-containing protein